MILEVNNTFDERRMYYLTMNESSKWRLEAGSKLSATDREQESVAPTTLRREWSKDFHVSPFNSRKGSYSLLASDPLSPSMHGTGPIRNTVRLFSSKGHGKLVAKLFQDGPALRPHTLTSLQKVGFLAAWWWVGFLTFPRIAYQAGLLFFKRKLHVWYRPEPLKESMGRPADTAERLLEPIFRRYLRHLVEKSQAVIAVKYSAGGLSDEPNEIMLSKAARDAGATDAIERLELKVLTPAFYTRFVYYAHDLEALYSEFRESATIWVSRPDLLSQMFIKRPSPALSLSSPVDFAYFTAIQRLRRRPERIERPLTSSTPPSARHDGVDMRSFRISSMDGFVLAHESREVRRVYRHCVLKLFLADKMALGSVALLQMQRFAFQTALAWGLSFAVDDVVAQLLSGLSPTKDMGGR